LSPQLL